MKKPSPKKNFALLAGFSLALMAGAAQTAGAGPFTMQSSPGGPTIGGIPMNTTQMNLQVPVNQSGSIVFAPQYLEEVTTVEGPTQGADGSFSIGQMAFSQAVPAQESNPIPAQIAGLSGSFGRFHAFTPQAPIPRLAAARPDFTFVPDKLEFEKVLGSSTTGQKDLGVGSGIPNGQQRFVPVGEF